MSVTTQEFEPVDLDLRQKSGQTLWKACIDDRIMTRNQFADGSQSGERSASQLVVRLAVDQLVVGCPAEVVTAKPRA